MLAALTGQRMLFNYFRIGGVNGDLNHEFMSRLGDWMSRATEQIEAGNALLNENEIFVRRMRGLGVIDTRRRCGWCMTGPNLRATGVPFDLRRAHPYSVYPGARLRHPDPRPRATAWPATCSGWTRSSRACGSSTSASTRCPTARSWPSCRGCSGRGPAAPTPAIEGPRGQYAAYAISDGTDQPFRMRIHDPSFIHLQAVGADDAGPPHRRHHGRHGQPGPDHGRRRQVTRARRRPMRRCAARVAHARGALAHVLARLGSTSPARKVSSFIASVAGCADLAEDRLHASGPARR